MAQINFCFDIESFEEGGYPMNQMGIEEKEKKFVIRFKEGTSKIFNEDTIVAAQEIARKENRNKTVAILAEMTPDKGAIPIDF